MDRPLHSSLFSHGCFFILFKDYLMQNTYTALRAGSRIQDSSLRFILHLFILAQRMHSFLLKGTVPTGWQPSGITLMTTSWKQILFKWFLNKEVLKPSFSAAWVKALTTRLLNRFFFYYSSFLYFTLKSVRLHLDTVVQVDIFILSKQDYNRMSVFWVN